MCFDGKGTVRECLYKNKTHNLPLQSGPGSEFNESRHPIVGKFSTLPTLTLFIPSFRQETGNRGIVLRKEASSKTVSKGAREEKIMRTRHRFAEYIDSQFLPRRGFALCRRRNNTRRLVSPSSSEHGRIPTGLGMLFFCRIANFQSRQS